MAPNYKIQVVADETYGAGDTDMTVQLTKIKNTAGVQAVLNPGFGQGPTVVVLGERSGLDAIDTAVVSADVGTAWRVLRPGIPAQGATLERL